MTQKPVEIALLFYPDCLISAIYGLSDLFRIANSVAGRHEGLKRPLVRTSHWDYDPATESMVCLSDTQADDPNDPRYIILPPSMIEPVPAQATDQICRWLDQSHRQGVTVCSVCAGSFLLAQSGLLQNRRATTHWMFADTMAQRYPDVTVDTDRMIIDDGDIITAGGIMAWTDLGLRLVQRLMGPTIMMETARILLVDPPGREQRYYNVFTPKLHHGDEAILKVQHWLQTGGAKERTVLSMARHAGLEERTFLRRFHKATGLKPTEYVQQVRTAKAREMLEFTHQNVDQIAWAVGYEDSGAFRKVFHKITGLTPGDYRQRFRVV